jgi:putative pyruvate formate lyase activating enzyme
MLDLQEKGAENINLVTPSHVVPQILEALVLAVPQGLTLPLVYNTGSYDSQESLALLDGVVDIYLPDVKCWDTEAARIYLHAKDYPETARKAVRTMHNQVGDLVVDPQGKARRGVLVRHLVMPGDLAGTRHWMRFLADLSPNMYVNVMGQYRPCGQAAEFPKLARAVTAEEVQQARQEAINAGLTRLDDRESRLMEILLQRLSGH